MVARRLIIGGILASAVSCHRPSSRAACNLPAATGAYRTIDDALVFELPDSGGFLVNGMPIERGDISRQIKAALSYSKPERRAVFVWPVGPTRCADVAFLVGQARVAGAAVLDVAKSGWKRPRDIAPDTLH